MREVGLAFLWHQHQPYYPDDVGQENPMPWVRLHGTKDYWGMAALLDETPEFHATINLVPSLLKQILAYTESGHEDTHLRVSRAAPDGLSREDLYFLMDNFFMVHPEYNIRPYRRYDELYRKRGLGVDPAERAAKRFSKRDLLDLQVWSNLVWFHPLAFERDPDLAEFRRKGKHYTQEEKKWLLDRQQALLAEVIPLHRRLQDRGQVELTTTPFYHPILPLLWDKRLARRAMPDVVLPKHLDGYAEDARKQVRKGVEFHKRLFGKAPKGMWPSEGSVCQEMIPALAESGIQWIATDEEILSCSTDGWVSRDANGYLRNPEMLYRPWRAEHRGKHVQMVFRDHAMSDQIGFHYQRYTADHAVDDLLGKVQAIAKATTGSQRLPLISIILDGENCWEYYPNAGVDFLRRLYREVIKHPSISPVRIGDHLKAHPAGDRLGQLFPGSWIAHNFGIWIGHDECNRAWDALWQTRCHLVQVSADKSKSREAIRRAWEELYIAEGSDWFWWFGDDHSSAQDTLFDRLFRSHLQNVYHALGETPPGALTRPISQGHPHGRIHSQPTGLLKIKVDGRRTYFEWVNAGRHEAGTGRGTMSLAEKGVLSDLYFGFDGDRLAVRLDTRGGPLVEVLQPDDVLRLVFLQPEGIELLVQQWTRHPPLTRLIRDGAPVNRSAVRAAADAILELTIPLGRLGATTDDPIHFYAQLVRDDKPIERIPAEGAIEATVPSADFELIMWQA
ncbi:MAG: hypothetical protein JW818_04850 [Pirellulales bacterium]|nr:hypothetical protein [Pirellulales bacterium]